MRNKLGRQAYAMADTFNLTVHPNAVKRSETLHDILKILPKKDKSFQAKGHSAK